RLAGDPPVGPRPYRRSGRPPRGHQAAGHAAGPGEPLLRGLLGDSRQRDRGAVPLLRHRCPPRHRVEAEHTYGDVRASSAPRACFPARRNVVAFVTQSTKLDGPELIEVLQVREVAYSLLARLFGEEPDPDFLRELHRRQVFMTFLYADENPEVREGTQRVAAHLAELETLGEDGFEALRWDYTRLFIGPDRLPAPPWESAYLTEERLLFQEPTLEVR